MMRTHSSWRRPKMRSRSRHSLRTLPTKRSAWAFAFGAWIGVRTISMPSLRKMLSKARLNFVSRSWIRKRGRWLRSARSISRLRACWLIHDVFDATRPDRDEEQQVQPPQPDGVDGEQVTGEDRVSLLAQERAPAGGGALWCGRDAGTGEHVADQRRRHRDPVGCRNSAARLNNAICSRIVFLHPTGPVSPYSAICCSLSLFV